MADLEQPEAASRRDFITIAATSFAGVGGALSIWPFIDQMNPNSGTPQRPALDIDLGPILPGQSVTVLFDGMPVFIRHRTRAELERARATALSELRDPWARNAGLPATALATDSNRTTPGYERWLVVVGLCTHLGCRLNAAPADGFRGDGAIWVCPCHAAGFDAAGRVLSGPAPTNLPVPRHEFLSATRLRLT